MEDTGGFPQFDVVSDHSDHHYSSMEQSFNADGTSNVYKKIMSEWKMLNKHLPDSIYVRVYDTRIDLLRAVIVGAAGTPYHDGLFFFDIMFPADYPTNPPRVYYHAHGLRLNPNLYRNGHVCLSLLNTWRGRKEEKWDPSQSTVLQVLVSIQALVLNEKPYFNVPVVPFNSENWSSAYSGDAFVVTWRTAVYLLNKPPKNFEGFTSDHFRRRASVVLKACDAYANNRVGVGFYSEICENKEAAINVFPVSYTFVMNTKALYPQLVAAFKKIGAENLVEDMKVEKVPPVSGCAILVNAISVLLILFIFYFCLKFLVFVWKTVLKF